jgi:hypothetical protein
MKHFPHCAAPWKIANDRLKEWQRNVHPGISPLFVNPGCEQPARALFRKVEAVLRKDVDRYVYLILDAGGVGADGATNFGLLYMLHRRLELAIPLSELLANQPCILESPTSQPDDDRPEIEDAVSTCIAWLLVDAWRLAMRTRLSAPFQKFRSLCTSQR